MDQVHPGLFEFHISRAARNTYGFESSLFSLNGNVILANFLAARQLADRMNEVRKADQFPDRAVRASEINAMGLIDEILHLLIDRYRKTVAPQAIEGALADLIDQNDAESIDDLLLTFVQEFPPLAVHQGEMTAKVYLDGETEGTSNRQIALEELIMLWQSNQNPAFQQYGELFTEKQLQEKPLFSKAFLQLHQYFEKQPKLQGLNLIDAIMAPARSSPDSLMGQLDYLLRSWGEYIGSFYILRLLGGADFIREETRPRFGAGGGDGGPGSVPVVTFTGLDYEPENFSPDKDWMPSLVLLAKNTYVWLDQLSKKYGRSIRRLDHIPDEELDMLRRWGVTGLWLIGLWERSKASQTIKVMCGNPDAVASAYSLYDYAIANDLGGDEAYQNLRERAWRRGIRLAADMVPNHVGITSRWVYEHPDWFVSLPYSPFPGYTFYGTDLSDDPRVGIYLEDHYYSREDAAVVFKREDRWTGDVRYIYHGNDGTSMPWNDTAQLNYLNPEVREAVIQTILSVARKFPVIRFDAAMTLAKRHYQRLWFPEPGSGGDIPSRAEFGLTKEQFNQAMPEEFWREVVDRVAQEVPDTLLLAEAFWLMEGYFVRTLGMHRVYNSAFMNMMRDERNAEYRAVIKNTLEFDPEILKRYVNFMNNPDERTAVDQFGKGDKYFGVLAMMITNPGLPMLGHGQIEGFGEKYGMEYKRAYWDESPDQGLVSRHEQEIFPLLHKRYLFAEVDRFFLYDFFTEHGSVDENVFAYSNGHGDDISLILFHNRYAETRGWIKTSASFRVKQGAGDDGYLTQVNLAEGLGIRNEPGWFTIFRDQRNGMEYLYRNTDLLNQGMLMTLHAYEYRLFTQIIQVADDETQSLEKLYQVIGEQGVQDVRKAARLLEFRELHGAFNELIHPGQVRWIAENRQRSILANGQTNGADPERKAIIAQLKAEVAVKLGMLESVIGKYIETPFNRASAQKIIDESLDVLLDLRSQLAMYELIHSRAYQKGMKSYLDTFDADTAAWGVVWVINCLRAIQAGIQPEQEPKKPRGKAAKQPVKTPGWGWITGWMLDDLIEQMMLALGDTQAWRTSRQVQAFLTSFDQAKGGKGTEIFIDELLRGVVKTPIGIQALGLNLHLEVEYFNKEALDEFARLAFHAGVLNALQTTDAEPDQIGWQILGWWEATQKWQQAAPVSGYRWRSFLNELGNLAK